MRSKVIIAALAGFVGLTLLIGVFSAGILIGFNLPSLRQDSGEAFLEPIELLTGEPPPTQSSTVIEPANKPATSQELDELFVPFWDAWDIIHNRFVDQPMDDQALMRGAIQGMLDSLGDPHTSYIDPDEYMQSNIRLEGEYQGIGAWVDTDTEFLTIISPMPGSPAERAGLKPGDAIIAIDGEDMTGIDGNLVIRRVIGPAGTKVTLTVRRAGELEPLIIEIVREHITIPSIESRMLEGNIAYIHLLRFGDQSDDRLHETLEDLLAQDPAGLILDLRFNGGGFLSTAVEATSEFLSEGVILYEEYGDGSRDTHRVLPGGLATEIPLIVLVNEGSASASEILAGAIQDYDRGLLVGSTTFGKGSVQIVETLPNNQGAVRVTIARWLTPNERQINGAGLTPDVEVPMTDEDRAADRDPQLDRAIELLQKESCICPLDSVVSQ